MMVREFLTCPLNFLLSHLGGFRLVYIKESSENRTVWNYWSLALWSFTSPCKNLQVCFRAKFDHFGQGLNILPWKMLAKKSPGGEITNCQIIWAYKVINFMWWMAIYTLCLAFMENNDKFRINTPKWSAPDKNWLFSLDCVKGLATV